MQELKHVGRVIATNKKCIVAYRTIPGDAYHCLIIPTESLQDIFHDALINLVESNAGQSAGEFAEVLARSNFPDGSIMLAALHTQGKFIKIPTDKVEMLPRPGVSIILAELNQIIAEQLGVAVDDLAIKSGVPDAKLAEPEKPAVRPVDDASRTTSASVNQTEESVVDDTPIIPAVPLTPEEQAKQYRSDADRLAKEAANFRRLADELAPVKPKPAAKVATKSKEPVVKAATKAVKEKPIT